MTVNVYRLAELILCLGSGYLLGAVGLWPVAALLLLPVFLFACLDHRPFDIRGEAAPHK